MRFVLLISGTKEIKRTRLFSHSAVAKLTQLLDHHSQTTSNRSGGLTKSHKMIDSHDHFLLSIVLASIIAQVRLLNRHQPVDTAPPVLPTPPAPCPA